MSCVAEKRLYRDHVIFGSGSGGGGGGGVGLSPTPLADLATGNMVP